MNNILKKVSLTLGVVAISVAASATTVWSLNRNNPDSQAISTDTNVAQTQLVNAGFKNVALSNQNVVPQGYAPDLTMAAESSVKAVVHIENQQQGRQQAVMDPFSFFFGGGPQVQSRPVVDFGSGVIISPDGYIITNNHVVENNQKLTVTLYDNRTFTAKLVGTDPNTDIALIKIDAKNLPTIPFGDSDKIRLGEWVLAVGNPFNLTSTVTAGIISAKSRTTPRQVNGAMGVESFIQTDAAVNPGNSGGALVNAKGQLIGINTMIYSQTGNYAGYSFAVPINIAAKVISDIKKYGSVQRAVLGIVGVNVDANIVKKHNLKVNNGIYVADFADISAALAAGIEKGDVIIAVNGSPTSDFGQLLDLIGRAHPGDQVKVTVNRFGTEKTFTVTLKNSEGGAGMLKKSQSDMSNLLGAKLATINPDKMRSYGISYGVEVMSVSNGPLRRAGIQKGFVILSANRNQIQNIGDLNRLVERVKQLPTNSQMIYIRGFYPATGQVAEYTLDLSQQ